MQSCTEREIEKAKVSSLQIIPMTQSLVCESIEYNLFHLDTADITAETKNIRVDCIGEMDHMRDLTIV